MATFSTEVLLAPWGWCRHCGKRHGRSLGAQGGRCGRRAATVGDLAQPKMLCQHFCCVAAVVCQIGRTHVVPQASFNRARSGDAFLQDLDADAQIGDRVECCQASADTFVFVGMHARHHLHQTLRPHRALRKRIETGFDGHDRQNKRRIKFCAGAEFIGFSHQQAQWFGRNAVFLAQPESHAGLFPRQFLGIHGQRAVAGFQGFVCLAQQRFLPVLQPLDQLGLACLAQVGAGRDGDHRKRHGQAQECEAVVGDPQKSSGHMGRKSAGGSGPFFCRCHSFPFCGMVSWL